MVRLVGAILVAAGCGWMGFRAAASLGSRVRALEDMADGLRLLEQELELDEPPLPRLMDRLIPRSRGPAQRLFRDCRQALDRLAEEDFSTAWGRLVMERTELGEEGRQTLRQLGDILGRCTGTDQRRGAAAIRRRLEELTARLEEDRRRQGRVYQTLGLSGGGFLVILLL